MAIRPFNVAHMPNIGVTCWSTASTRKPAAPPIAEAPREGQQHGAPHIDADQMRRDRIADDGAQAEAEAGAVEREMHGRRQRERADQHDQMIDAQQERPELERRAGRERRERIGVARQDQDRRLLELHPDREARHHRGDAGAGLHRREAEPLDVDAGEHRADDHGARHRERAGAVLQIEDGAEIAADHDRRAVGQVEPAHHAEDQREAERQQPVGRADHHAVDGVLDEVDHRPLPRLRQPAARRVPR